MPMTEGSCPYASALTPIGTNIANVISTLTVLANTLIAAEPGWSVQTAPIAYGGSSQAAWMHMTHSSGCALIAVLGINSGGVGVQIVAENSADGVAKALVDCNGMLYLAWQPPGVSAPTGTPLDAGFLGAATNYRLVRVTYTAGWMASTARRIHVVANNEGFVQIVGQNSTGSPETQWIYTAGQDIVTPVVTGDVSTHAHFVVSNTSVAANLTLSTNTIAGECLNAAGTARVFLNQFGVDSGAVASTVQTTQPYVPAPILIRRSAADLSTGAVAVGQGTKGVVNRFALQAVPPAVSTKGPLKSGKIIHWYGGFAGAWKNTNVVVV